MLRAIGVDEDIAHSSIRIGLGKYMRLHATSANMTKLWLLDVLLGRFTTEEEVDFAVDLLETSVKRLRDMSPLWEMVQEGIDLKTIQWTQDSHHH